MTTLNETAARGDEMEDLEHDAEDGLTPEESAAADIDEASDEEPDTQGEKRTVPWPRMAPQAGLLVRTR